MPVMCMSEFGTRPGGAADVKKKPIPCPVCNRKPQGVAPLGENDFWECSHVECPNRHKVTAAPSDRPPKENP